MSEKVSNLIRDRVGCIDGWYKTEEGEMRSPLMDAIDAVEAIESENVILCMQLADMTKSMNRVEEQCAKLRERCADLYAEMITYSNAPNYNASVWAPKLREVGVEVDT